MHKDRIHVTSFLPDLQTIHYQHHCSCVAATLKKGGGSETRQFCYSTSIVQHGLGIKFIQHPDVFKSYYSGCTLFIAIKYSATQAVSS